jgi:hypothetical protein
MGLTFSEALELLKQGKRVKRAIWGGYWFIPQVTVYVCDVVEEPMSQMIVAAVKDGSYAPATPYQADLLANDWEEVE